MEIDLEVLRQVGEKRFFIITIRERRENMFDYLLRHNRL